MPAKVVISFIFCWTFFVLGILFIFSPEIKRIAFGKDKLEMERFREKVDKALVEYDEFKKTIYPLLEASMGQIVSVRYLQMPPKSSVMLSYIPLVEQVINKEHLTQPEIQELFQAVKAMTLYGFSVELGKIADKASDGKIKQTEVEELVNSALEGDYSKNVYVNQDDIYVDFKGLNEISKQLPSNVDKDRYDRRLKQLTNFYNKYYVK